VALLAKGADVEAKADVSMTRSRMDASRSRMDASPRVAVRKYARETRAAATADTSTLRSEAALHSECVATAMQALTDDIP
jgi:hypothetical protein